MNIQLIVEIELTHVRGKFASREELIEKLKEEIENADPGTVDGDNEGEYEVAGWCVDELPKEVSK